MSHFIDISNYLRAFAELNGLIEKESSKIYIIPESGDNMTITVKDRNKNNSVLPQDDNFHRWYRNLKSATGDTADTWLANMKMVQSQYGKSPDNIARMTPEEAYNFVLDIVKSMQNEGRSFSYIDTMIKSINDWIEFNGAKKTPGMKLSSESGQVAVVDKAPHIPQSIYKKDALLLLKEKSDGLLKTFGRDFVNEMRALETMLTEFDPAPDSMISSIDKKVNKGVEMDLGAYYLAAFSSTRDPDQALNVYRMTNSLMRYIALMDSFYETNDKESLQRASRLLDEITATSVGQMRYAIKLSIEKFWPFWMFENMIKQRILDGDSFAEKELRYFILFKSSDTPLLYCTLLDSHLETFNPNVAMVFHYNQALIDILDDYYDIEEDVQTQMPNIFMMAASGHFQFSLSEIDSENIRRLIMGGDTKNKILSLVEWLNKRLEEVALPAEYSFLNHITTDHIHTLKSTLV